MTNQVNIKNNYLKLCHVISSEKLMIVSKKQSQERIEILLKEGHRIFGENQYQEALEKWQKFKRDYPDLKLNLIGPLQTNKIKGCVTFFDHISTLSRFKEVDKIKKYLSLNPKITFSIQINISEEPQKSGILLDEFEALYEYALKNGLVVNSVMAIPEKNASAEIYINQLKIIKSTYHLAYISYGTSHDYIEALQYGSDQVRIGSAIFGKRD